MQFHITGIDTTNYDLVNQVVNNILEVFPNCEQWQYNILDDTTMDILIVLGV